jgi:hypothetical protein
LSYNGVSLWRYEHGTTEPRHKWYRIYTCFKLIYDSVYPYTIHALYPGNRRRGFSFVQGNRLLLLIGLDNPRPDQFPV